MLGLVKQCNFIGHQGKGQTKQPRLPLRIVCQAGKSVAVEPVKQQGSTFLRDDDKEASRVYRRVVYNTERWADHRSTGRYVKHMGSLPGSRIIRSLSGPILYSMGVAALVGLYETCYEAKVLPEGLPSLKITALEPITLTSFALSLLLVFRTNSSYQRFDEARKQWGLILNRSRDIVRMGLAFFPVENTVAKALMCRWTIAFSKSLYVHLRSEGDLRADLQHVLRPEELDRLMASPHRPVYTLHVLGEVINQACQNDFQNLQMSQNVTSFQDQLGGCERLLRTPIPLSYTRHTVRFLLIWLTFLPFALWAKLGWAVVPTSGVVSMLLLGIEEIGVQIEDPFGILPLEAIAAKAEDDITSMARDQVQVRDMVSDVVLKEGELEKSYNQTSNSSAAQKSAWEKDVTSVNA